MKAENPAGRKPPWLRVKLPSGTAYGKLRKIVSDNQLHTICESGNCPNIGECWGNGTATFMILGNICTRSCGFCAVSTGKPHAVDPLEAVKVARSIKLMGVKHCVITSVDRDDLEDGGANAWVETIMTIKRINPATTVETLIPDFKGEEANLLKIANAAPDIVSHNLETVRRLTRQVRIQAKYDRSLYVLKYLAEQGMVTKSGIMTGLGESEKEVMETLEDLKKADVKIITIGQYLQPTPQHLPVVEFVTPEQFEKYGTVAAKMGFTHVESGPLVRSSYHAEKHISKSAHPNIIH